MAGLQVYLFGAPRIVHAGAPVAVELRKTLALLAYLVVERRTHSRDTLAALFWPELDQQRARTALRHTLVALNQAIGKGWLAADRDHLALRRDPELYVDIERFQDLLARVSAHNHLPSRLCEDCLAALTEATGLYKGDFMAGFSLQDTAEFDTWQAFQADALQRDLAAGLEQLALALAARRALVPALAQARRWLALDPLCEAAHRTLMQLYAWSGDRSAALRQYDECVRILAEELQIEPAPETTALRDQLAQPGGASGAGAGIPVLSSAGMPPLMRADNLPPDPTPFVGRAGELDQIAQRLADPACRLLTVLGPGGMGKTRLAIQAARGLVERFRDGDCFVDLTAVSAADSLPAAILRALDAHPPVTLSPEQALLEALRGKQMLLLLDNCEHLLAEVDLFAEMLRTTPGLTLLATSRVRLNLREEWLLPLAGLEVPEDARDLAASSATALFLACLRRLHVDAPSEPGAAAVIVRICRLLDGMPLGIELAAAWARTLPMEDIAAELERNLGSLTTNLRDVPARHRSLFAAFEHSWHLLTPHEQSVLGQLAVFSGGFTAEAARAVSGATSMDLRNLVDASWLGLGPAGRFTMHEAIRQYCSEKLSGPGFAGDEGAEDARRRHAAYYTDQFRALDPDVPRAGKTFMAMTADVGNASAAWGWAIGAGEPEAARWMGEVLSDAEELGWLPDALPNLDSSLAQLRARDDLSQRPDLVALIAYVMTLQGNRLRGAGLYELADTAYREGLELLASMVCRGARLEEDTWFWTRYRLAMNLVSQGRFLDAGRLLEEQMAYLRQAQDAGVASRLAPMDTSFRHHLIANHQSLNAWAMGRYTEAQACLEGSPAWDGSLGEFQKACCLRWLGPVLHARGDYVRASRVLWEAVSLLEAYGERANRAYGIYALGLLEAASDRYAEARAFFSESLATTDEVAATDLRVQSLNGLARTAQALGETAEARRLYEQSVELFRRPGSGPGLHLASALVGLGQVALVEGDIAGSKALIRQALSLSCWAAWEAAQAIAGMAEALVAEGEAERAAELLAFVEAWPAAWHETRRRAARRLRELESGLRPDVFAAAVAQGHGRQIDELVAGLVAA